MCPLKRLRFHQWDANALKSWLRQRTEGAPRMAGAWVTGYRREIASFEDRRPLQIAEVHNLGGAGLSFFLGHKPPP